MFTKALHVSKRDLALSVSVLQNSEMFKYASCTQSMYLLLNSEMLENEITNCRLFINKGLIFKLQLKP